MTEHIIIACIVSIPPTVAALCSLFVSVLNRHKITIVHREINSRMDELLKVTKIASHAEGMKAQRDADKQITI